MAKFYDALTPTLSEFIQKQHLFFTASAAAQGRVNVSPKGGDSLRILDPRTVAYLDITGSGNETAAHILDNGRLTLMFCSVDDSPLILRLYGQGEVITPEHPAWDSWSQHFPEQLGTRQVVVLHIDSLQTSCGYGVPRYTYLGERDIYQRWAEKKGREGIRAYQQERNSVSIDGLPTCITPDTD